MKKILPFLLLVVFVLGPVFLLGAAGRRLLQHERDRWEAQADTARQRHAETIVDDLRDGLDALRVELREQLARLPGEGREDALRDLRESHPLVRNVFMVNLAGDRVLPPPTLSVDEETDRFLHRYSALFGGRAEWTPPALDEPTMLPEAQLARRAAVSTFGKGGQFAYDTGTTRRAPPPPPIVWRPWRWEDDDMLLAYLRLPDTGDLVGLELEMSALYGRLDVLLRLSEEPGQPLALLDRANRHLVASGETPEHPPVTAEIGPLLPFARLALYPRLASAPPMGQLFHLLALAFGFLLLLSISGAGLGLTAWLNRSRREALRKTTFVSNVSHEFKTPLTTLRLYTELLLEDRVTDPEKRTKYLRTMRDESDRLARLVHNVLDFSRLEMKRKALHPVDLDLTPVLRKVTDALAERFVALGITVTLPAPPLPARVDPDAAEQIILNLCDNVLKYACSGKALEITAHPHSGTLHLLIQDFGLGIPRDKRKHLFKPFHQIDDRLARENGGTGLGLHIARRLARECGGDLRLVDCPTGTCFLWTLPTPRQDLP